MSDDTARRLLIAEAVATYANADTLEAEYYEAQLRPILDEMIAELMPDWYDADFVLYPELGKEIEKARLAAMTPEQRAEHDREEAKANAAMEATFGPILDRLSKEDGEDSPKEG